MKRRPMLAGILSLLIVGASPAAAHEDYRVIGTIAKVTATTLDVKQTKDDKTISSRLLKNTRIGLFSWPSCVSRPPRQRCARGHAVPTRGPATPAAGDQGHLASRFRNRTKL